MGDEDGEVDRPNPAPAGEGDRAGLVVMQKIENEEETRDPEGGHHADLVTGHLFLLNEQISEGEENGTRAVEKGVDGRERRYAVFARHRRLPS